MIKFEIDVVDAYFGYRVFLPANKMKFNLLGISEDDTAISYEMVRETARKVAKGMGYSEREAQKNGDGWAFGTAMLMGQKHNYAAFRTMDDALLFRLSFE